MENDYALASSISFTARNPDDKAPCIQEGHRERCSPAKCMRPPSASEVGSKSFEKTNAHAPRDHSSSSQHFVVAPSKFASKPGNSPSSSLSVLEMRSDSFKFVIRSASPGRA